MRCQCVSTAYSPSSSMSHTHLLLPCLILTFFCHVSGQQNLPPAIFCEQTWFWTLESVSRWPEFVGITSQPSNPSIWVSHVNHQSPFNVPCQTSTPFHGQQINIRETEYAANLPCWDASFATNGGMYWIIWLFGRGPCIYFNQSKTRPLNIKLGCWYKTAQQWACVPCAFKNWSHLWEFAWLDSRKLNLRNSSWKILLGQDTSKLVLVLVNNTTVYHHWGFSLPHPVHQIILCSTIIYHRCIARFSMHLLPL